MSDKRINNTEVITHLKEVLAAMEVKKVNRFRIRAYQNAISILDNLTASIYDIWENGKLHEIPGVGAGLTQYFNELFTTGKVKEFEQIKEELPEGMFSLIGIRGIGAKKAFKIAKAFKLNDREKAVEKTKKLASEGKIRDLEGFGEKSEKDILDAIEQMKMTKNEKKRILLVVAETVSERVINYMNEIPEVVKIDALGSLRRRNETVGDLDFVVATDKPETVIEHFVNYPEVHEVLVKGDKKAAVVMANDIQADLRVSTPEAYGSMLQYNTGSKQHNIILRTYALERGMSLSEYGIKKNGKRIEFSSEEDFYQELGLPLIPPELRQGGDEIELAVSSKLPKLIQLKDIRGEVHTHTTDSADGESTFEEMIETAIDLGYEYYGISDHAPSIISRGEKNVENIIKKKRKLIDDFNNSQNKINVFYGYEVNILADAKIAMPNDLLKQLDYAIGAIHTSFNQDREQITKRLLSAIENPYIDIIGHPGGRLINERDPVDPDWNRIFNATAEHKKILEINAQPSRLDLTYDLVKEAIKRDIKLVINTDAHLTDQLHYMKYGIDVARRGGAEPKDIINTLTWKDFKKYMGINRP